MATTYEADSYGEEPRAIERGVTHQAGKYTVATALVINDIIRFFPLPKNAMILDAWVSSDDLDTNVTPLITLTGRVSNGTTTKNAFVASTVGQAGGVQRADEEDFLFFVTDGHGYYFEVLVAAAPATGATSVAVRACLLYTMQMPFGEMSA